MKIKLITFLLFPVLLFSQNNIRLKVVDDNKSPVFRAIVVISQNNNQLFFGTTDENGVLEKKIGNGQYECKISKLGFSTMLKTVAIDKEQNFEFVLHEEINKLKDVVITARPKVMRIKEDTISYNLKAVVDGTERKVEDVIKKLPGLSVNEDGKVLYKGQKIDKVLIDGNEFFGKKHQMATQNIDAEFISGIDLLTNYTGFALANNGTKEIALNLKTKDEFQRKWIHAVDMGYGGKMAKKFHSNSFRFFKNGNVAVLTDFNTLGKAPISREDYSEMKVVAETDTENGDFKAIESPNFLNTNNLFKEKKNLFLAINYTNLLSPKTKLTFSTLYNQANLLEETIKTQTSLGNSSLTNVFKDNGSGLYFLNNSILKLEHNYSKDTYISYIAGFTPSKEDDDRRITDQNSFLNSNKSNGSNSFSQFFRLQTKFFQDIKYVFSIKHSVLYFDKKTNLNSNESLFNTNYNALNQKWQNENKFLRIVNAFSYSYGTHIFNFKMHLTRDNSGSVNSIFEDNNYFSQLDFNQNIFRTDFSWMKNWNAKLLSTIGVNYIYSDNDFLDQREPIRRLEPNFSISYSISGFNKITFDYSLSHKRPEIFQLQDKEIINDFQTIIRPSAVNFNEVIPRNDFSLQYLNFNSRNYSVLFASFGYSLENNTLATNTLYESDFVTNQWYLSRNSKILRGLLSYDLKFQRLPFSIKSTVFYTKNIGESKLDGLENNAIFDNLISRVQFFSNFKKFPIQFLFDYNFVQRKSIQELNSFKNTFISHQFAFVCKGKSIEKIKWDIGFTLDNRDSGSAKSLVYFLNSSVDYQVHKHLKLFFSGYNMLNLNNTTLVTTNSSSSFFTESSVSIMPGYFLFGVNFSI